MLLITSVYIDFLLIRGAGAILNISAISLKREILASVVGSMFSLIILLPKMNTLLVIIIRLAGALIIMAIAFGYDDKKRMIKRTAVFFFVSLVFSGICLILSQTKAGKIFMYKNGNVYLNISAFVLIISSAMGYGIVKLFERFSQKDNTGGNFTVTVYSDKKTYKSFPAVSDSGNFLADMITGTPVIIFPREMLSGIYDSIPENEENMIKGWRLIPCHTVSGSTLIPITKPYRLYIRDNFTHHVISAYGYVGVSNEKMEEAVFNPVLLRDD